MSLSTLTAHRVAHLQRQLAATHKTIVSQRAQIEEQRELIAHQKKKIDRLQSIDVVPKAAQGRMTVATVDTSVPSCSAESDFAIRSRTMTEDGACEERDVERSRKRSSTAAARPTSTVPNIEKTRVTKGFDVSATGQPHRLNGDRMFMLNAKLYALAKMDAGMHPLLLARSMGVQAVILRKWASVDRRAGIMRKYARLTGVECISLENHLEAFMERETCEGRSVTYEHVTKEFSRIRDQLDVPASLVNDEMFARAFIARQLNKLINPASQLPVYHPPNLSTAKPRRKPMVTPRRFPLAAKLGVLREVEAGGDLDDVLKTHGIEGLSKRQQTANFRYWKERRQQYEDFVAGSKLNPDELNKLIVPRRPPRRATLHCHLVEFIERKQKNKSVRLYAVDVAAELSRVAAEFDFPPKINKLYYVRSIIKQYNMRLRPDKPTHTNRGYLTYADKIRAVNLYESGVTLEEIRVEIGRYICVSSIMIWKRRKPAWMKWSEEDRQKNNPHLHTEKLAKS